MIDEENTRIVDLPIMKAKRGLPFPFASGSPSGISDHLPIAGQLILSGDIK
jgi:hypothetical protein